MVHHLEPQCIWERERKRERKRDFPIKMRCVLPIMSADEIKDLWKCVHRPVNSKTHLAFYKYTCNQSRGDNQEWQRHKHGKPRTINLELIVQRMAPIWGDKIVLRAPRHDSRVGRCIERKTDASRVLLMHSTCLHK